MYILGINPSSVHDTAACLIKDGRLISFVEEERLNRQKNTCDIPFKSIDYLCQKEGINVDNIDCIAVGLKFSWGAFFNKIPYALTVGLLNLPSLFYNYIRNYLRFKKKIKKLINYYSYTGKIVFVDHHSAHLSCAYLASSFKKVCYFVN